MKTLIFIHGGESFVTQEEYLDFLNSTYISWQSEPWVPEDTTSWTKEIAKKWHEQGGIVYMPVFPNKLNAKYAEWKIVFEGIISQLNEYDEVTCIGGSLGGCFLLKYFSEQSLENKIDQIHLVAACISSGDFSPPSNYDYLETLGDQVHIWHAADDRVVPFSVGKELSKVLPHAQTHFFESDRGYGHFHGIERIRELEMILQRRFDI